MENYKITAKTNSYIAQRDAHFNGKTEIVIRENLTIKEAQKELLTLLNEKFDTSFSNWGLAVIGTSKTVDGANRTFNDGTRSFEFDSRIYRIEKHEE